MRRITPATERNFAGYVYPRAEFIGNGRATAKLYKLEEKRSLAIRAAAHELAAVLEIPKQQFWTHALPESLFNVLESFQPQSAIVAAVGYLRRHGVAVDTSTLPNFPTRPGIIETMVDQYAVDKARADS